MDEIKDEVKTVVPTPEPKKDAVENMVVETYEPKKNCRKCHGRGIIGYIEGDVKQPYYCSCLVKVKKNLTMEQAAVVTEALKNNEPKASV